MIFWEDKAHEDSTYLTALTVSTTANGYAAQNVRTADLERAWKSLDNTTLTSPTGDEWLKYQFNNPTVLGTGDIYFAVAYDARGADQNEIKLQTNSVDDGSFDDTLTTHATHTLNKTGVSCWYSSFAYPAKKYYRLVQLGPGRGGTTGVTAKILRWEMHAASTMTIMSRDYPGMSPAPWNIRQIFNAGGISAAGGLPRYSRFAQPSERFQIPFAPGSTSLREKLRDGFYAIGGPERAIMVQFEGLYSPAKADFFMSRLVPESWSALLVPFEQYAIRDIEMETERWR